MAVNTHDPSGAPRHLCPACGLLLLGNYCVRCQRTLSSTVLAAEELERQRRAAQEPQP